MNIKNRNVCLHEIGKVSKPIWKPYKIYRLFFIFSYVNDEPNELYELFWLLSVERKSFCAIRMINMMQRSHLVKKAECQQNALAALSEL